MSCPVSYIIDSIEFASYGTPVGSCGSFEYSSCSSNNSMSVVNTRCLGQQSCNITATHSNFGGDTCFGATKHLYIEFSCLQERKWIGLVKNVSSPADATGYYNFQTSFSIPGPNTTFDGLIIPMAIASANSINLIKLNGKTLYDCETDHICDVSSSRLSVFFLSQFFQSNNLLEVVIEIAQDVAALGLLVEFRPMMPLGTGQTNYNFDLAWLLVSAPYLLDHPKPASIVSNPSPKWFKYFSSIQRPVTTLTSVPLSNSHRALVITALSPVCLYGDCADRICVKGTKCVRQNPYYSQCLLDPTTDRTINCVANYGKCTGPSSTCCSYAFSCSGSPFQCLPQSGDCISSPSSQPTLQPSKQPTGQPFKKPTMQPSRQPKCKPSKQPSQQPTKQPIRRPSRQPSTLPSMQPTLQPTYQPSPQPTLQPSHQPIHRPSNQPSISPTAQPSKKPTMQPSKQPTLKPSIQPYRQPTVRPSKQPTSQPSKQPINRPSMQPSIQPSLQPSLQPTSLPSKQPSSQPSFQPYHRPSSQPSTSPTLQPSHQPTIQPSFQPSNQPSSQPSSKPTVQPSKQPTYEPSLQPSNQPSRQPSIRPTVQPSQQPTKRPTTQPTFKPSKQPSHQPTIQPSKQPTFQPSQQPSNRPSMQPSIEPTGQPLRRPSCQPSKQPTSKPSYQPSKQPSRQPSTRPTSQPSQNPTMQPSKQPSCNPSKQPSQQPTMQPSTQPTSQPSMQPTHGPSMQPSIEPSRQPSLQPTSLPSEQPTCQPSFQPYDRPSRQPSSRPTVKPSKQPTIQPSKQPTLKPSKQPSLQPTLYPSKQPTAQPSIQPSKRPSKQPSSQPSTQPLRQPTLQPSHQPNSHPSVQPSTQPSSQPSNNPTLKPSKQPTKQPSRQPSSQPFNYPSNQPLDTPSNSPSFQPLSSPSSQPSTFLENVLTSSSLWISSSSPGTGTDIAGYYTYQSFFYIDESRNLSCLDLPIMISAEFQVQLITLNGYNIYRCCTPRISSQSVETLSTFGNLTTVNSLKIKILNQNSGPTGLLVSFGKIVDRCKAPLIVPQTSTESTLAFAIPTFKPLIFPTLSPSEDPTVSPTYTFTCPAGYSKWETVCVKHSSYDIICPQGYMFEPNNLGCIPASQSPTQGPSEFPTTQPTFEPSILPSRPTSAPICSPTEIPSLEPTLRPSESPTWSQQPSIYPTFEILNFQDPKLLHTYKFNDLFGEGGTPSNALLVDSTSGAYAMIPDNSLVQIVDGNAVFVNGYVSHNNYLILPHDFLGPSEIITVEVWVRYEKSCPSNSILFSFGDLVFSNNLLLTSSHDTFDVYIAVVYNMQTNPPSRKLYIDGSYNHTMSGPSPTDAFYHPEKCYIGNSSRITNATGMDAKIDEFRVWSGELPAHIIYSHYLTGVDPSHITLSSFFTVTDINVTYYATSLQLITVGMYGGNSQFPMFGDETEFTLTALGAMCDYSLTYTLDSQSSSYSQAIAAMNYSVTLTASAKTAPTFTDCGNAFQCFCDPGKPPVTYLTETGKLSQDVYITEVGDFPYHLAFTYHTGICFEVKGSEHFSEVEGPCIDSDATILHKRQNWTLSIVLFELYPDGHGWLQSSSIPVTALNDYRVDNGKVIITDLVSHIKAPQHFNYTTKFEIVPPSVVNSSVGLNYTISAGDPLPSTPFSWSFNVRVERIDSTNNFAINRPDIPVYSASEMVWFIPIIGIIANEVPNFYPVASDPTMIYLVLRDPPGGSSSTTFHSGKSLSFDMSVDQLETFGHFASNTDGFGGGLKENEMNIEAPLGGGVAETGTTDSDGYEDLTKHTQTISYARGSDSHYTVTIAFSYDISTSQDPKIAGHLSDVIVGGGVDLIVSEAIQGN